MNSISNFLRWLVGFFFGIALIPLGFVPTAWQSEAEAPPAPVYSCDSITVDWSGDVYRIEAEATAHSGAEIFDYVFDLGGNSGPIATENPYVLATFGQTSTRDIRVMVLFEIDAGHATTIEVDSCQTSMTFLGSD